MGLELSNEQRGEVITRYPFNERLLTWLRFKSIKSIERPNESLGPALVKIKEINHPPPFSSGQAGPPVNKVPRRSV